ncbi:excalibur calcium-binding domain-containing protein [Pasteurellaceae bacterium TAE3-ERU1]|nr:excalibur calcium-binding domain-containing protein [Pasteurellaceae bacterium TAE3-ERU1]
MKIPIRLLRFCLISTALFICLPAQAAGRYSCNDPIPYCKYMESCAQARFYYEQCGVRRLDGDNDGVPCEVVCRRKKKRR